MKKIKYLSLALILFIGMNSLQAQEKKGLSSFKDAHQKEMMHKKSEKMDKWKKELNLSDQQTKEIEAIKAKNSDKMKQLHEEMMQLKKEQRAEIEKVYTPEQKAKLEKLKADFKNQKGHKKGMRKMNKNMQKSKAKKEMKLQKRKVQE